jgi:tRNA A-37 threonylcarbamoyl transferase component Bud32
MWLGAAIVALVGAVGIRAADGPLSESVAGGLATIRDADVAAIEVWLASREAAAKTLARSDPVRSAVAGMVARARAAGATADALRAAPEQKQLEARLEPSMGAFGFTEYALVDPEGRVIAASAPALVGWRAPPVPEVEEVLRRVRRGETLISRPFFGDPPHDAAHPVSRAAMFAASPVRDYRGNVIATLGLGVDPEEDFGRILALAKAGRSGETYAFDAGGRILSRGRFASSVRAAGGPLTRAMAEAVAGRPGVDVAGYPGPRGAEVVGAWTWLPRHGIGVVTEIEKSEAYRNLAPLRWPAAVLVGAALVAGAGAFALVPALRRRGRRPSGEAAGRLGPYVLEEKLGEGGMGAVYRARHEVLQRIAAVKVIRSPLASRESIARFEREAQLTSRLAHPNTIAIFDYGQTDSGVFYYAMEFVEGISLERLVQEHGPQPERRVIHVLKQIASSLAEAHGAGLVHRDVKPGNVMLSSRPDTRDLVKVLDFGLVKELRAPRDPEVSLAGEWVGTPLYVAPEIVRDPASAGPPSDIYGVGATAYFLLTGCPPIDARTGAEVVRRKLVEAPPWPSSRIDRPLDPRLERLVMACLEMPPEARPGARQLTRALSRLETDLGPWTPADAQAAWEELVAAG